MEVKKAIEILKKHHPYPEDIFIPLQEDEKRKCVYRILEAGLSVDRYSAELMRLSWNNCIKQLELLLNLKEEKIRKLEEKIR